MLVFLLEKDVRLPNDSCSMRAAHGQDLACRIKKSWAKPHCSVYCCVDLHPSDRQVYPHSRCENSLKRLYPKIFKHEWNQFFNRCLKLHTSHESREKHTGRREATPRWKCYFRKINREIEAWERACTIRFAKLVVSSKLSGERVVVFATSK